MTRDTYTTTMTKPRVLDVSYTSEVTRLATVLLAPSMPGQDFRLTLGNVRELGFERFGYPSVQGASPVS